MDEYDLTGQHIKDALEFSVEQITWKSARSTPMLQVSGKNLYIFQHSISTNQSKISRKCRNIEK